MKNTNRKKLLGLSVAAALLLGTTTYAGKIITNAAYDNNVTSSASAIVAPNTQFGFGGWNMDNVEVRIVNALTISVLFPATEIASTVFNQLSGLYTDMSTLFTSTIAPSFESTVLSRDGTNETRALLHGKNWPVGEPSGIKVINNDLAVHEGDPTNCIINSSYLEGYYLNNVGNEQPTVCSSGFQTHKRFKVNMMPSTVTGVDLNATGGYGKPIDLVFNLDPADTSTAITRYQVLQKINNYTGTVLDGYKLEVLDGNGNKNANLTVSLDKWEEGAGYDDMANFSHGLWGEIELPHFPSSGFFDNKKAYYPVTNTDSQTIEWHGDIQGGNYMAVLRSNWITWANSTRGLYWNDDNDTATDAKLIAFWGRPPAQDTLPEGWYKGQKDNWVAVTADELGASGWDVNGSTSLYYTDTIEDVLNLGITYTVNIGQNSLIGDKFIIRITPHVNGIVASSPLPPVAVSVASDSGSGGGFDSLDKTSLIAMILGFLGIGAFIARRRFTQQKN